MPVFAGTPDAESNGSCSFCHLLDDLFQFLRHARNRLAAQLHRAIRALLDDDVSPSRPRRFIREIFAEVAAAAFLAVERGAGDGLGDGEEMLEIERGVPAGIIFAVAVNGGLFGAIPEFAEPSSACAISLSVRTMPTRFCIMSCSSCWIT